MPVEQTRNGTHANGSTAVGVLPEAIRAALDAATPRVDRTPEPAPPVVEDSADLVDYAAVRELHRAVSDELTVLLRDRGPTGTEQRRAEGERLAGRHVTEWVDRQRRLRAVSDAEEEALLDAVLAELVGLGRLDALLRDERIENVTILGFDHVRIEYRDGRIETGRPVADSDEHLIALVQNLARRATATERALSPTRPMLDLQLPDGSRLTVVYQISQRPVVVIRKHGVREVTLDDLTSSAFSLLDPLLRDFFAAAMKARLNIMIAGYPGAGKTTLVRGLAGQIPRDEWFVVMEESRELGLHTTGEHPWAVSLEAREGHGDRGADGRPLGEITLDDMIPVSLRLNTARVIVGEVRSREIVAMLQAMGTTGGSLCTIHARGPELVFDRVVELALAHRNENSVERALRQVAGAIDLIVYVELIDETAIGGRKHRFVSHVLEVGGIVDGGVKTTTVFGPGPDGRAVPLHLPERHLARLRRAGYQPDPLNQYRGVGAWPRPLSTVVGDR
jgi:Flp pilus assembly CpaF family ATPase